MRIASIRNFWRWCQIIFLEVLGILHSLRILLKLNLFFSWKLGFAFWNSKKSHCPQWGNVLEHFSSWEFLTTTSHVADFWNWHNGCPIDISNITFLLLKLCLLILSTHLKNHKEILKFSAFQILEEWRGFTIPRRGQHFENFKLSIHKFYSISRIHTSP